MKRFVPTTNELNEAGEIIEQLQRTFVAVTQEAKVAYRHLNDKAGSHEVLNLEQRGSNLIVRLNQLRRQWQKEIEKADQRGGRRE